MALSSGSRHEASSVSPDPRPAVCLEYPADCLGCLYTNVPRTLTSSQLTLSAAACSLSASAMCNFDQVLGGQAGKRALHWAASYGEGVSELLDNSLAWDQLQARDAQGNTPLHLAAQQNQK